MTTTPLNVPPPPASGRPNRTAIIVLSVIGGLLLLTVIALLFLFIGRGLNGTPTGSETTGPLTTSPTPTPTEIIQEDFAEALVTQLTSTISKKDFPMRFARQSGSSTTSIGGAIERTGIRDSGLGIGAATRARIALMRARPRRTRRTHRIHCTCLRVSRYHPS